MSVWVKICANTSWEDALLAADAGADAVGFVFAHSPRRVTAEQVAAMVPRLPLNLEKIGVFVDASAEEIAATVRSCGLTGVQLHTHARPDTPGQLRSAFGPGLRILAVIHFGADAAGQAAAASQDPSVDAVLVDSRSGAAMGGTGLRFDWDEAARLVFRPDRAGARLVAAGGLNPESVADAIARLRPWGVDVASGVESVPGKKDPARVREFVRAARAASIKVI